MQAKLELAVVEATLSDIPTVQHQQKHQQEVGQTRPMTRLATYLGFQMADSPSEQSREE